MSTTRKLAGEHCRCATCGEYFNSTAAFDKHRIGDYASRRCRTPIEMRTAGMDVNAGGWWITSKNPNPYPYRVRRNGDLPNPAPTQGGCA